jgi:hypothetical protein
MDTGYAESTNISSLQVQDQLQEALAQDVDSSGQCAGNDTVSQDKPHQCAGGAQRFQHECGCDIASLKEWYEGYMSSDGNTLSLNTRVIETVAADDLDSNAVETTIQELMSTSQPAAQFCINCQHLFDNWPELKPELTSDAASDDSVGWEHTPDGLRYNTYELEASMRNGCRFCAFMVQALIDVHALEVYRKIENRLSHFIESPMGSLSIQNWTGEISQLMWLNFPEKVSTHCNFNGSFVKSKVSSIPDSSMSSIEMRKNLF